MDKNQIIILADALTYLLTFIYWLVKLKRLNVGLIILAIMAISHIGAVFYYAVQVELGLFHGDIQILPFIYLYLLIMICLLPFLQHKGIKWWIIEDVKPLRPILPFLLSSLILNRFLKIYFA